MRRHRHIAASPQRSAPEAWQAISTLIGITLERSSSIDREEVDVALEPLETIARMLIAAGHLEKRPMVLVADGLWLEIQTVSGGLALTLEENLNPVPGAAGAATWMLFIPQVEPLAKLVRSTVKDQPHLSADAPSVPVESDGAERGGTSAVDLEALARWAKEGA